LAAPLENDLTDHARAQWVALSLVSGLGSRLISRLLDHLGTLEAILAADERALRAVQGIGPVLARAIRAVEVEHTAQAIAAWQADGIALALRAYPQATGYPARLLTVADAPPVIFSRGTVAMSDARAVGLVGTRQPSRQGQQRARAIAAAFAELGWTVVSGLATGIDTAAHQGALAAGGRTLAALGCGVRVVYPPENAALAGLIRDQGALLSEVEPDAPPNSAALVARNRMITGLSRAVIVVESSATSGTRHAARFAAQQGRPVYALSDGSAGNSTLIDGGALPLPPDFAQWPDLVAAWDQMAGQGPQGDRLIP
jgi:DNA processing protein